MVPGHKVEWYRFAEKVQMAVESSRKESPEGGTSGLEVELNILDGGMQPAFCTLRTARPLPGKPIGFPPRRTPIFPGSRNHSRPKPYRMFRGAAFSGASRMIDRRQVFCWERFIPPTQGCWTGPPKSIGHCCSRPVS